MTPMRVFGCGTVDHRGVDQPLGGRADAVRRRHGQAAPGQTAAGAIEVAAGSDAALSIPVVVVNGARPGPVLALLAGAHGTEYASIIALEQLAATIDASTVSGTVIVVPLLNVPSFQRIVPHLNPVDGKNMNRMYPGRPDGTQTERASYAITRQVVEKSDHLIDFHGGDIDENLRPYSYWQKTGRAAQDAASLAMVLAFGLDHIIITTGRPTDPADSRYLENTATTRGKPSITVEAGRAGTVEPHDVAALVTGTLSVMRHLKMLPGAPTPVAAPGLDRSSCRRRQRTFGHLLSTRRARQLMWRRVLRLAG